MKDIPRQGTPWLEALKNVDAGARRQAENGLDVASSLVDEISVSPTQRGARSAKRGKERLWHFWHLID